MRALWIALLSIAVASVGCSAGSDPGEEESSVDREEELTTLTCASLEQRLLSAIQRVSAQAVAGCSSAQSQSAYETAMMEYFATKAAMTANRCCTSGRCMSKPLATAIASVNTAAKGACMQHACLTRGLEGTPLASAIRQLDCNTEAEVAEFLSNEKALTEVCRDPSIRGATSLLAPALQPTAFILQLGASLQTTYCGKALSVCGADNADCRSAIRCRDYLEHDVPYMEGHLQDVVDANCAGPAQLSAYHKASGIYDAFTAPTLASCAPYYTPEETAQVAAFTALAENANMVCEKSQGCLDALTGLESLIDTKLMPIAAANCAGQSLIDQQAQLQTQVDAFNAELSTCEPYLIETDDLRYAAASAEASEVDQVCSASADCRGQLAHARTSASAIATIKSHNCPAPDEDAYLQAKSDFSDNFIDANHSCMAHMTAADKQELTSLQSTVAASACVFCGIEGRRCCGGVCGSGTMCGGNDGNTCVPCGKSGIACCPGSAEDKCGNGLKCSSSNTCQACGQKNLDCCDTGTACFQMAPDNTSCQSGKCKPCGHVLGGPCCADSPLCYDGMTCEGTKCVQKLPAGEVGGDCLLGNVCNVNSWARCNTGTGKCQSCGGTGQWCCGESSAINKCNVENRCVGGDTCAKCGNKNEICCDGNACPPGNVNCNTSTQVCE